MRHCKQVKPMSVLQLVETLLAYLANFLLYMIYITIFPMFLQVYYAGFLQLLSSKRVRTTECCPQNGAQPKSHLAITTFRVIGEHVLTLWHATQGKVCIYQFMNCVNRIPQPGVCKLLIYKHCTLRHLYF